MVLCKSGDSGASNQARSRRARFTQQRTSVSERAYDLAMPTPDVCSDDNTMLSTRTLNGTAYAWCHRCKRAWGWDGQQGRIVDPDGFAAD